MLLAYLSLPPPAHCPARFIPRRAGPYKEELRPRTRNEESKPRPLRDGLGPSGSHLSLLLRCLLALRCGGLKIGRSGLFLCRFEGVQALWDGQ